ncbi:serine/threonine protein kinase [Gemmatimonadota bacterium]
MIGQRIDRYEITEKLGEGGMGAVWKAIDTTLGRFVALKTLSPHLADSADARERFLREAQAASALNHPNITTVHDLLETEDRTFICMECVDGTTLRDRVQSGPIPVIEAIDIILQVADALASAHEQGVLHRDIKSANIMVDQKSRIKLMDFGLAHLDARTQLTRTGTTMGTVSYSSPEQLTGGVYDSRSEIWSLGAVFHELLSGMLPFRGDSEGEIIQSVLNVEAPPLSNLMSDIPAGLEAIVLQMLQKEPGDRYQSIIDLQSDLTTLMDELQHGTRTGRLQAESRLGRIKSRRLLRRIGLGSIGFSVVVTLAVLLRGPGLDYRQALIVEFDDLTDQPQLATLGRVFMDALSQDLYQADLLDQPPQPLLRSNLERTLSDEGLGKEIIFEDVKDYARKERLGLVVLGSIIELNTQVSILVKLYDVRNGRILDQIDPVELNINEPEACFPILCSRIRVKLAKIHNPFFAYDSYGESSIKTISFRAYQLFSDGVRAMNLGRYDQAIEHLSAAYHQDTTFVLPLIFMITAYTNQSRYIEASDWMEVIAPHQENFTDFEHRLYDHRVALTARDHENSYPAAVELAKASNIWSYLAGYEALCTNRPYTALSYFKLIDPDAPWFDSWVPYWRQYANTLHCLGKYRQEWRLIREARQRYPQDISLYMREVRVLASLGKLRLLETKIDEVLNYPFPAERLYVEYILSSCARELELQARNDQDIALAVSIRSRILGWLNSRPESLKQTFEFRLLDAQARYANREWGIAGALFDELIQIPSIEDDSYLQLLRYQGVIAARTGDEQKARAVIHDLDTRIDLDNVGTIRWWQANIAAVLGDLEVALDFVKKAFQKSYSFGDLRPFTDMDLENLLTYPPYIEWLQPRDR